MSQFSGSFQAPDFCMSSGYSYKIARTGRWTVPSRTSRAASSSALNTPAGGSFDCVVICSKNPSGRDARAPRTSMKTSAALPLLANSCVSSISVKVALPPGDRVRISRLDDDLRESSYLCVIVRKCCCKWNNAAKHRIEPNNAGGLLKRNIGNLLCRSDQEDIQPPAAGWL